MSLLPLSNGQRTNSTLDTFPGPAHYRKTGQFPDGAVITGTIGSIRFESEFNMPGSFVVASADGSAQFRYEEPTGRQFEGLHFQAAEVARRIAAGDLETPCRSLQSTLDMMETLDRIRCAVGIEFSAAGLIE